MYELTVGGVMERGVVPMAGMVKPVARAADDMPDTCIVALWAAEIHHAKPWPCNCDEQGKVGAEAICQKMFQDVNRIV